MHALELMKPWESLLDKGDLADLANQVREATDAIASDLSSESHESASGHERRLPFSLAYGHAGIGLFLAYFSTVRDDPKAADAAREQVEKSLSALSHTDMPLDLFRGVAGIAWVFSHVRDRLWAQNEHDSCVAIDSLLTDWAKLDFVPAELMHGLAGLCVYALERMPRPSACHLLETAVTNLGRQARSSAHGKAWSLPPQALQAFIADHERLLAAGKGVFGREELEKATAEGLFRPGVAHGVSGVMSVLSAVSSTARTNTAADLACEAMRWVREHQLPAGGSSVFPELAGTLRPQHQTGWCNGDLGISVALIRTASLLQDDPALEATLALARGEAERGPEGIEFSNLNNPILCHGHSGRAHLFNRLYQMTGEEIFRDAAIRWYRRVIELWKPGQGCGGFLVDESGDRFVARGFLMGCAGIGLSLLAATSTIEPEWDRVLAISHKRLV